MTLLIIFYASTTLSPEWIVSNYLPTSSVTFSFLSVASFMYV